MVDTASVADSEFIKLATEKESDSEMESEDGEPEVPKKKVPNVVSGSRTAMLEQVPLQAKPAFITCPVLVFLACVRPFNVLYYSSLDLSLSVII